LLTCNDEDADSLCSVTFDEERVTMSTLNRDEVV